MYLACIRLRVGALAIEVLATALARVHAFDPLEELALLAAVEAARWLGLLGLLLVCSLVEALCAFRATSKVTSHYYSSNHSFPRCSGHSPFSKQRANDTAYAFVCGP